MTRKGSQKVRTGCITCKIRKVKCDETKPSCDRCVKTGRKCDGYAAPAPLVRAWDASRGPVRFPKAEVTLEESRALDYFHRRVASAISGHHHTDFWTHLVVQISQQEPAVRHAAVAISTLYEHLGEKDEKESEAFAIKQYNESIKQLVKSQDQSVALFSCVLLMCAEFLQGNVQTAIRHCRHGVMLLNSGCIPQWTHERLLPVFARLSIFPFFFGCRPAVDDNDTDGFPLLRGLEELCVVDDFHELEDAQRSLAALVNIAFRFGRAGDRYKDSTRIEPSEAAYAEQAQLAQRLERWEGQFQVFRKSTVLTPAELTACLFLEMKHIVATIWVAMALEPSELGFFDHLAGFKKMVNAATLCLAVSLSQNRPKFLFEMCFLPLLYFVVTKCRCLATRTAALRLMKALAGHRENLWDVDIMAEVGRQVIELEHGVELDRNGYEKGSEEAMASLDDGGPPVDVLAVTPPDPDNECQDPRLRCPRNGARRVSFIPPNDADSDFIPRERIITVWSAVEASDVQQRAEPERLLMHPCRGIVEMEGDRERGRVIGQYRSTPRAGPATQYPRMFMRLHWPSGDFAYHMITVQVNRPRMEGVAPARLIEDTKNLINLQ